ncbi:hypothetical protein [Streptomyces sp. NPDC088358]|uniref:hypothetical protein n=1 Tax=Streptomyces sp. NPDC088358 TaxID=3365857 RepID=UPI003820C2FE
MSDSRTAGDEGLDRDGASLGAAARSGVELVRNVPGTVGVRGSMDMNGPILRVTAPALRVVSYAWAAFAVRMDR